MGSKKTPVAGWILWVQFCYRGPNLRADDWELLTHLKLRAAHAYARLNESAYACIGRPKFLHSLSQLQVELKTVKQGVWVKADKQWSNEAPQRSAGVLLLLRRLPAVE